MSHTPSRRRFVSDFAKLGIALAVHPAGFAATEPTVSGVLYGIQPAPVFIKCAGLVLSQLQTRYQPDLGDHLVVIPGNSFGNAIMAVHGADADGGTALLAPSTVLTLLPQLRTLPGVDPTADFYPIAAMCETTLAFIIGPAVPAEVTTMAAYLAWVRANPTKATYATPGPGTGTHLAGAELARLADVNLHAIPYKSNAAQTADVASGAQPAAFGPLHNVRQPFPGLRILALTSGQRWPGHPDVPTMLELKLAEGPIIESYGFYLRVTVPAEKRKELGEAIDAALRVPEVRAALSDAWLRMPTTNHLNYAESLVREREALLPMVTRHGFTQRS